MVLLVLFTVFMILALVSHIPGDRFPGGVGLPGGLFLWLSVLTLYFMNHGLHITG